jgi:hypothetical protein
MVEALDQAANLRWFAGAEDKFLNHRVAAGSLALGAIGRSS